MSIDSLVKSVFTAAKKVTRNTALQYSLAFSLLAGSVGCADRSATGTVQPDAGRDMAAMLCVDEDQDGIYSTPKCGTEIDCDDNDTSVWQTMHAYTDLDNDGFGAGKINEVCARLALPIAFSLNNQDCDDYNSAIRPGGQELCDGIDNDCDLLSVDGSGEGAPLNSIQYGVCLGAQQTCTSGAWIDNYTSILGYEANREVSCDGLDNNCDNAVDELVTLPFYQDVDGDGFGTTSNVIQYCTQPEGYTATLGDCNDENSSINPSIEDICDSINNDCDEEVDEDASVCEKMLFASYRDGVRKIYVVNSDGSNLRNLSIDFLTVESHPKWSPDARRIYFMGAISEEGTIKSMKPDGSDRITIIESGPQRDFGYALSPDGTKIVFPSTASSYRELYVVNTDGGNLQRLIVNNDTEYPVWSPDGMRIAFLLYGSWGEELYTIRGDGTDLLPLNDFEGGIEETSIPSWSPDSAWVAYSCQLERVHDGQRAVYVAAADGSAVRRITSDNNSYEPRWSPDGDAIAYFSRLDWRTPSDVYVTDPEGGNHRNLTSDESRNPYSNSSLSWSPDGRWLAFVLGEEEVDHEDIYIARPDGSELRRVTDHPENVDRCDYLKWSRDSNKIVYSCRPPTGGDEIYIINIDGTDNLNLSNSFNGDVEFDLNF